VEFLGPEKLGKMKMHASYGTHALIVYLSKK